jgi:glyoxalase family protein
MSDSILGLHHITAIAGNAQRNYDFYQKILGLRFVKKTVNFDDPGTYHFYYGDEYGSPGTILTFFPWTNIRPGSTGTGMATEISYAIAEGSLAFWKERFVANNIKHSEPSLRFGEQVLPFEDPDGLKLNLVIPASPDTRTGWQTGNIPSQHAVKGFRSITLTLRDVKPTAEILTGIFGYTFAGQEGNVHRFRTDNTATANIVDIIEEPNGKPGIVAGGTNHHVAFRVKDEDVLMHFREKIEARGLNITPKIDRNYFYSLYFREPGGVLFEIATDNPGFAVDEPQEELGQHLKLPAQYETQRSRIESILPVLQQ